MATDRTSASSCSMTDGRVFWARRIGRDGWQFPQGGMRSDETPLEAMYRELEEETGLARAHVEVLGSPPGLAALSPAAALRAPPRSGRSASARSRSGSCCAWSARNRHSAWTPTTTGVRYLALGRLLVPGRACGEFQAAGIRAGVAPPRDSGREQLQRDIARAALGHAVGRRNLNGSSVRIRKLLTIIRICN